MRRDFNEFKRFVKGKKVAIVGIGVSNRPLINMMVDLGANVVACDKKTDIGDLECELREKKVELFLGDDYLNGIKGCDIVFRTPSLRPDNEYIENARKGGAYITSEMGEFLKYCPCKIFGVTGSDGKTTTTTLISEMLKEEGFNVFIGGNIGTPLFNQIEDMNKNDFAVVELSSFQLMDIENSPDVSVITNLSPNHLDIHKDMEEYINSKKNIFAHQDKDGIVILNRDNNITNSMINEVNGTVKTFSIKEQGCFSHLDGSSLVVDGNEVCEIEEVKLPGMHNIENLLTAFAAVSEQVSINNMRKVAVTFAGVEHRIELVRELNGIKFYNDSIASSPTRTAAGLNSFNQKVILIAGGYDKKIPFDVLAEAGIEKIKTLILMGKTKEKIRKVFEKKMEEKGINIPIIEVASIEEAVEVSYNCAENGDIITLSPACASFDMFKNFEVRGNTFKEIVNNLK